MRYDYAKIMGDYRRAFTHANGADKASELRLAPLLGWIRISQGIVHTEVRPGRMITMTENLVRRSLTLHDPKESP